MVSQHVTRDLTLGPLHANLKSPEPSVMESQGKLAATMFRDGESVLDQHVIEELRHSTCDEEGLTS